MEKRYQVFVSSTFKDLQEERQEVMHALLELDCIPSGMELFPAANETQWDLIKKVISDCDYYILILGGRYGSIGPSGLSYTEMEYRCAIELNKPTIAFLHKDAGKIISEKTEKTTDGAQKLEAFRQLAEKKLCKHWTTPQDLGSVVSRSLIQLIKSTPAIGWVRADELPDKDSTLELLKLRRKVEELEIELTKVRVSAPKGTENLAKGDEEYSVSCSVLLSHLTNYKRGKITTSLGFSWDEIFDCIAPLMIHEAQEAQIRSAINKFTTPFFIDKVKKDKKYESYEVKEVSIVDGGFHTIIVQLRALGLITKSEKNRSVKDRGTYWTLTPYGDETMTRLRAIESENATSNS